MSNLKRGKKLFENLCEVIRQYADKISDELCYDIIYVALIKDLSAQKEKKE